MSRFFFALLVVALLLLAAAWMFVGQQWIAVLPSFYFQTLIFLLFGTGLLYVYLYKFDKPGFFVHLYLVTIALKLLAYGAYVFFMITEDNAGAAYNVVWFLLLYFILTALEIAFLFKKISKR